MATYPLCIVQYMIKGPTSNGTHWTLAAIASKKRAHVFEVCGNTDTYHYAPKVVDHFDESQRCRGGFIIEEVSEDLVESGELKEKLQQVVIHRNNPEWNPEKWVMDAVRFLQGEGVIHRKGITTQEVETYLDVEKEKWNEGKTSIEHLFKEKGWASSDEESGDA